MTTVSLAGLFTRALESASKATSLLTIEDTTQDILRSSLDDLNVLTKRVSALSLFSPNESLEDIATKDLLYLLVPYVLSEVRGRVREPERHDRMLSLNYCQDQLRHYLLTLENYDIVPRMERSLYEKRTLSMSNAAERRELKIKQYKKERELRTRIQEARKRRRQTPTDDSTNDFDFILSLLPSPAQSSDDEQDDDENVREAALLLLRLIYAQSQSQLESMDQELELLRNIPPPPPPHSAHELADNRKQRHHESNLAWRLDTPSTSMQGGPQALLDAQGRPLHPFTIVPSREAADRARLQAQVFGPDHRFPTMSIDEYLEIERQRGNVLTGGGPQSASQPTSSEQLALDAEMDGTAFGEEKAEEKRLKDENWAMFTDENPRGAGNTMNRG